MELPVNEGPAFDVVVVGGGVSGSVAAIAAARCGARVLVVEEQGFPGGSLTAMGVGPMMSFHNPAGEQVVRGIPDEIIGRLRERGASTGHIADTTTYCSTVTPFDSEALKIELETMLADADCGMLYHTQLAAVETDAAGGIARIIVCNKAGLTAIRAKVFVDATGDGDLAARAGVPFQLGREKDGAAQPMTMNLKLANVDTAAIRAYALAHPEDFLWHPRGPEEGARRLRTSPRISLAGFLGAWKAARERGEVDVPRDQVLFFETAEPGVVIVNTSRITGLDATDPFALGKAGMTGRRQCARIFDFLRKHAVGFSKAIRMDTAAKIGVRESRHIRGLHVLTAEDILGARDFEDAIALGAYPIDIHSADGAAVTTTTHLRPDSAYRIPLRSLLVERPENLVVVGRCISATHEASAAFRVTPIAMAIGQGGGVAAALAALGQTAPARVPFAAIRERLLSQGAKLS
ncbi:hypothetical protein M2103_001040 [Ereboglobus sp. PH5-5]|uniref:FAD-dependent oxidoreductase n=1 Tax=Ereboglobus sp. PH5-5 TaxID=2940529 RepID=UPI0024064235|nr:FAD-dependent oxidoreductase [Ereboglobus sp. PH5-5]MDF9832826.1 hypothetical protein [Ereboglobus sp. PH5-5]